MSSNPSHSNSSRFEGCTLTGALAVTTQIQDAISIIHGPAGCAHHNFSLLHATLLGSDAAEIPHLLSTHLTENDIIFGGEEALEQTLAGVLEMRPIPASVFVISTCIVDTIGDDVGAVCAREWGVPLAAVPTSGFLGGVFENGVVNALIAAGSLADPPSGDCGGVNLIGEKNLEFDVEENYAEVRRLLSLLGLPVNLRFVRGIRTADLRRVGGGAVNVLREPSLRPVGEDFRRRFGTPWIDSFPVGLAGTLRFLEDAAALCGVESEAAVQAEAAHQEEMLSRFADLAGTAVRFDRLHPLLREDATAARVIEEITEALDLRITEDGTWLPAPYPAPVGTAGIRRMLYRWRKAIRTGR